MFNRFLGAVLAAAAIFVACADASAHVVLDVREAKAGSYFKGVFRVGHGCAGSPTIRVAVTIPDGINSARPQPKPGWDIEIVKRKLETPRDIGHGRQIDEVVSEVVWKGGPLPNAYFDEFAIQIRIEGFQKAAMSAQRDPKLMHGLGIVLRQEGARRFMLALGAGAQKMRESGLAGATRRQLRPRRRAEPGRRLRHIWNRHGCCHLIVVKLSDPPVNRQIE